MFQNLFEYTADMLWIDRSCCRGEECLPVCSDIRIDLQGFLLGDKGGIYSVCLSPFLQFLKPYKFRFVFGNYEFLCLTYRDVVLLTEGFHKAVAFDGKTCFETVGCIVEACMKYTTVSAACMHRDICFLVDDGNTQPRVIL